MPTRTVKLLRAALASAVLWAASSVFAQQPLVTPNYYAFQLTELRPGQEHEGELTATDGQNFKDGSRLDMYSVSAEAGQPLTIRVTSPDFEPVLSVYDAAGSLVAFSDYGYDFGDVTASFVADTSGRFVVVVSGWADYDLGAYTVLRVEAAGGPDDTREVTVPTSLESAITIEMPPLPNGFGGGAEYFGFELEEETLLLASMASQDLDAYLTLFDSTGAVIAENDDDGYSTDSMLVALLQPGSYVIAASTYFAGETGGYTLTLESYYRR